MYTCAHTQTREDRKNVLQKRKLEIHSQLQYLALRLLEIKKSTCTKGHETHVEIDFCHLVGGQTRLLYQTALEKRLDTSIHHSHETEFAVANNQIN